jgi:hypothetical protein
MFCAAGWRWVRVVLRSELVSAVLGTAFAVMAVSVCWLLSARTRTQRVHSTALAAAQVQPVCYCPVYAVPSPVLAWQDESSGQHAPGSCLPRWPHQPSHLPCPKEELRAHLHCLHIRTRPAHSFRSFNAAYAHCPGQSDAPEALAAAHQTASEPGGTASLSSLSQQGSLRLQRLSSEMLSQPSSGTRSLEGSGPGRCAILHLLAALPPCQDLCPLDGGMGGAPSCVTSNLNG